MWLTRRLGVDARSVALFRVAMAALALCDVWRRWDDAEAFHTDAGVVPPGDTPHRAAVHRLAFYRGGSVAFQQALLLVHAALALALLVGYRSRCAAAGVWAMTAALHGRNEYVVDCGDRLQRNLLFWLWQTDCGRFFSADAARASARRAKGEAPPPAEERSFAAVGLHLQTLALYWGCLAHRRHGRAWYAELSATWYAMHNPAMVRPLGSLLAGSADLCAVLTASVVAFEAVAPLLLLVVRRPAAARTALVASFWAIQAGFGAGMRLELFPFASAAAVLPFLPAGVWDGAASAAIRRSGSRALAMFARGAAAGPAPASPPRVGARGAVSAFFVAYVLVLNLGDVGALSKPDGGDLGEALRINQWWVMFSPEPSRTGTWTEIRGSPGDVDLMAAIRVGLDRPAAARAAAGAGRTATAYTYKSLRWQKYIDEAVKRGKRRRIEQLSRFLCRKWRGESGGRLESVRVIGNFVDLPRPHYRWLTFLPGAGGAEAAGRPEPVRRVHEWTCE